MRSCVAVPSDPVPPAGLSSTYEVASRAVRRMARDFHEPVTDDTDFLRRLYLVSHAMQVVDAFIDSELDPDKRRECIDGVKLVVREGETLVQEFLPAEVTACILGLRQALTPENYQELYEIVDQALECGELLKRTTSIREHIRTSLEEGELSGSLGLLVCNDDLSDEFQQFVVSISGVGNLFDNLIDARQDSKAGERR